MQLAGSRFFSYNLYPLEILQSSVVPELELVEEVQIEAVFPGGTKVVTLHDPIR